VLPTYRPPLRVDPRSPGQSDALLGGDARRRWVRKGAGSSSLGFRSWICSRVSLVASWSRSPDLIGQIWRAQGFILLVVLLRWQEQWHGVWSKLGISFNKAVLPCLWRFLVLVRLRSTRRSPEKSFVKPSRWWLGVIGGSGETFFNKRMASLPYFWRSMRLLPLLAGHGGAADGGRTVTSCSSGGDWGVCDTASAWSIPSGAHVWQPNLIAVSQHL